MPRLSNYTMPITVRLDSLGVSRGYCAPVKIDFQTQKSVRFFLHYNSKYLNVSRN